MNIDRSLVRNLDVNGERSALLSTLLRYARNIGTLINDVLEIAARNGNTRRLPLMACTIAVITNRTRRYIHLMPMLEEADLLLRQVKNRDGSANAIDYS